MVYTAVFRVVGATGFLGYISAQEGMLDSMSACRCIPESVTYRHHGPG